MEEAVTMSEAAEAHVDGGVPNILIETDTISARSTGELIYFFELACGVSGYVLGVNPFNQPGVEAQFPLAVSGLPWNSGQV